MTTSALVRSCFLIASLLLASTALADDGLAVMQQVEAGLKTSGEQLAVTMEVTGPRGSETRTFRMWTQAMADKPARNLIRFETPGNIAGTALLSVQRPGKKQDSWLYVPALDQVRRIAPADRSESFVGSDFTIEDLTVAVDPEAREYTLLGEAPCGDGRTCLQLQDAPKTDAAAKASAYGRVVLFVDKEHHVTWRVDFYDKADGLLKVLTADGLVQVGESWRFDQATVTNVQAGSKTVMTVTSRDASKIDPSIFSPSTLDSW
ncbi:MAG: outer membrane lipoprotein-sorting protein [Proteobacteria bacterium]|nr:outer membrane lipoprotein-sorting protein [Pseudomonadota bacterium]